ncbi:MAG TPA: hypothetical protein VKQ72_13445 [Aggregatilineales bacterium]|nr:hypothetical protein [Aggregatilineales bacterium]
MSFALLLNGLAAASLLLLAALAFATPQPSEAHALRNLRNTPVPEPTLAQTLTPAPSLTPTMAVASATPVQSSPTVIYPTILPQATIGFAGDKFGRVTLDRVITDNIGKTTWLSFVNINDKVATIIPGTPAPANQLETLYLASPSGGLPVKVMDLPATTGSQLYWSPNGAYLAYFLPTGSGAGLYILDLTLGGSLRLFQLDNLDPRGIASDPVWSPDSKQIAIALANEYDVDIYTINADGTNFRDLTISKGFDFWPAWSPDGQYLAFVSDRLRCASYVPNEPGSCYRPDAPPPDGGNLFVMEAVSGQVRQVSEAWVIAPPHWISASRLAFTGGTPGDPAAGSSLWWADLRGGPAHQVTATTNGLFALRDSWTSDGNHVIYQELQNEAHVVIRDGAGNEIARSTDLNFPRVAFSASWSPDNKRIVMGGRNGQCPYGMLLTDDSFNVIVNSAPNPGVCDPSWSPDGRYIAFTGVTRSGNGTDGRIDVYVAEANGYAARNLTGKYGGQIRVVGWVGTGQ